MKKLMFILIALALAGSSQAQSFFKPIPKPKSVQAGKFGLATDSIHNSIRPVVGVTATIQSNSTSLAGGVGIGFQHNKWDVPSQSWNTVYSISAIAFLGGGSVGSADVTAGLVVGLLNLISLGGGYDFTSKQFVLLTGVQIHFN